MDIQSVDPNGPTQMDPTQGYPSQPSAYRVPPNQFGIWQGLDGLWYDAKGNQVKSQTDPTPIPGGTPANNQSLATAPMQPAAAPTAGGGGVSGSGLITGSPAGPPPGGPPSYTWGNLPNPPQWQNIPTFTDPTMAQVQSEPGFQFGQQQGQQALTQDKAQQGLLYGGGTLKDILAWGDNFATQFYNDARNRMKDTFMTNVQNQYVAPYQANLAAWQTLVPQDVALQEAQNNTAYNTWVQQFNQWQAKNNYALDVAKTLG